MSKGVLKSTGKSYLLLSAIVTLSCQIISKECPSLHYGAKKCLNAACVIPKILREIWGLNLQLLQPFLPSAVHLHETF